MAVFPGAVVVEEVGVEGERDKYMQVVIIIVTRNNANTIEKCLQSLYREKVIIIVVVDNFSTDTTIQIIEQKFPEVRLIKLQENIGYGAANNIGIEECLKKTVDYILILNPDAYFLPETLKNLLHVAKSHENKGIFGPTILKNDKKTIWSAGGELDVNRWTAKLVGFNETIKIPGIKGTKIPGIFGHQVHFVSGTCMLIPRQLLETGLRFFEPYFLYYEDVEFCIKAAKKGFLPFVANDAYLIHDELSERSQFKQLKNHYLARNHLLFVERNAPFRVKLREFIRMPKTIYEHVKNYDMMSVTGIQDYFMRRFHQYENRAQKTRSSS